MKKIFLLLSVVFCAVLVNAQSPKPFQTVPTWYDFINNIRVGGSFRVPTTLSARADTGLISYYNGYLWVKDSTGIWMQQARQVDLGGSETDPLSVHVSDSASMLAAYRHWLAGYLTSVDTTNIPDFSVKVRSLLNAGYGLLYSNGTYTVDSFLIATRLHSQHLIDSMAALTTLTFSNGVVKDGNDVGLEYSFSRPLTNNFRLDGVTTKHLWFQNMKYLLLQADDNINGSQQFGLDPTVNRIWIYNNNGTTAETGLSFQHFSATDTEPEVHLYAGAVVPNITRGGNFETNLRLRPREFLIDLAASSNLRIADLPTTTDTTWKILGYNPLDSTVKMVTYYPGGDYTETDPLSFHLSDTAAKTWDWGDITGKPATATETPTLQQVITAGATLTGNNTIVNGANTLSFTGSGSNVVSITNSSSGVGLQVLSSPSGSNSAIQGISTTSSTGAVGQNNFGGYGLEGLTQNSAQNTVISALAITRISTGGSGVNNIGVGFDFLAETSTNQAKISNQLISKWTDATDATRTSQFIVTGVNSGTTGDILTLNGNKSIKANGYGSGTFTGTPAYTLQVDASGNIIEGSASGSTPTLTSTYIGYGDGSNLLTGTSTFSWDNTNKILNLSDGNGEPSINFNSTTGGGSFIRHKSSALRWAVGYAPGTGYIFNRYNSSGVFQNAALTIEESTGNVGINTTAVATAILELSSGTKGFLAPRMSGTQQAAITSPATGLMIYNTDSAAFTYYTGSAWTKIGSGGGGGGYTNLTQFVDQTAHRLFYSDASGDVQELALGADGTFLKSNGATSAPSFATPGGGITVGTTTITSGTSGAIPFNNAGVYGEDATQLFWDDANNRLGIGTASPLTSLEIPGFTNKSSAKFGIFEIQSYATNNAWLADNGYFDGSNFKYRVNGSSIFQYFSAGAYAIRTAPGGTAGTTMTLTARFGIKTNGDFGLGGTLTSDANFTGATLVGLGALIGIGTETPTARLHIAAGTATAGTAPIKLTSGVVLTTPENGAVEYDGTDYWGTADGVRMKLNNVAGSGTNVFNEEHTGSTSSTITLSNSGTIATLRLYKNGVRLPVAEFTYSGGTTVTLTSARVSGDLFTADYKY